MLIPGLVQRPHHITGETRRFGENSLDQIFGGFAEDRQFPQTVHVAEILQNELHVLHRGVVVRHLTLLIRDQ